MITIHPKFRELCSAIPFEEVNLGCGGLHLFQLDEIEAGQIGYSTRQDGSSLCTGEEGAWRPEWLVIGFETACGDPLLIDMSDSALPVFHDFHGQGRWDPAKIAVSFEAFILGVKEFAQLAVGRGSPVELEANPLSPSERTDFLTHIADLNKGEASLDFWEALTDG